MSTIESPSSQASAPLSVLRWIAVLPASFAGGWVAWILVNFLNRLTMGMQGLNPDSFLNRAFLEAVSNGVMGAATVYVGAKVAPTHRRIVVFVLAMLSILAAGFLLFPAVATKSGWAIYAVVCWVIGAGGVAWSVYSGDTAEFDD